MTTYELFGDKYDEKPNPRNAPDDAEYEPCAYCGKAVRIDQSHHRVEFDDQGWYAIGPECQKKFPGAKVMEPWREPGIGLPYHDTHAEKFGNR